MSVFQLAGGAGDPLAMKLTTSNVTVIAEAGTSSVAVPWFQCTEMAGGTPNLTIDILKPDSTVVYLRNAVAMTAKQEVKFSEGILLLPGWKLRVTASVANQVDVTGIKLIDNN